MKVIYGSRRSGRTTQLIEACAEAEKNGEACCIVCHSHQEARRIMQRAEEMGLEIPYPISFDALPLKGTNHYMKLYIDNAEFLLQQMLGMPIEAVTIEDKIATHFKFADLLPPENER